MRLMLHNTAGATYLQVAFVEVAVLVVLVVESEEGIIMRSKG